MTSKKQGARNRMSATPIQDECSLTAFQQMALSEYQRYTVKYRVSAKNAHITIRHSLMDWLAQPVRREKYNLEVMPAHEQAALIDAIVDFLQKKRTTKALITKAVNKNNVLREADKARQNLFEF